MIVDSFPDREITIHNKQYLYFGGTSYLGMSTNPKFQKTIAQSINKWGTFYGSSRNSNIKLSIYNKAEKLFAEQIGAEDAVTVSSGALAGQLVIDCLTQTIKAFYHYPKTHPAILNNKSLPLFIDGKLHPNLLNHTVEDIVITADTVLSLEVTPTTFEFLNEISSQKRITLLVDESHSFGIVAKQGEGVFNTITNPNLQRKIMVSSLGKAIGLSGGIIAADKSFIDNIKKESIFISSSGMNPAYLEAYFLSQDLFKLQREKLKTNLEYLFKDLTLDSKFKYNTNYPVIYSNDETIYNYLFKKSIVITNFKYPTYNCAMNRIVITANHTHNDLDKLISCLKK